MSNTLLIALVLVVCLGGLFAAACFLDKRAKAHRPALPKAGPVGRIFKWAGGFLVAMAVATVIGALVFRSMVLVQLAGAALGLYVVDGIICRILLSTGK
jgi:hypothetical protein